MPVPPGIVVKPVAEMMKEKAAAAGAESTSHSHHLPAAAHDTTGTASTASSIVHTQAALSTVAVAVSSHQMEFNAASSSSDEFALPSEIESRLYELDQYLATMMSPPNTEQEQQWHDDSFHIDPNEFTRASKRNQQQTVSLLLPSTSTSIDLPTEFSHLLPALREGDTSLLVSLLNELLTLRAQQQQNSHLRSEIDRLTRDYQQEKQLRIDMQKKPDVAQPASNGNASNSARNSPPKSHRRPPTREKIFLPDSQQIADPSSLLQLQSTLTKPLMQQLLTARQQHQQHLNQSQPPAHHPILANSASMPVLLDKSSSNNTSSPTLKTAVPPGLALLKAKALAKARALAPVQLNPSIEEEKVPNTTVGSGVLTATGSSASAIIVTPIPSTQRGRPREKHHHIDPSSATSSSTLLQIHSTSTPPPLNSSTSRPRASSTSSSASIDSTSAPAASKRDLSQQQQQQQQPRKKKKKRELIAPPYHSRWASGGDEDSIEGGAPIVVLAPFIETTAIAATETEQQYSQEKYDEYNGSPRNAAATTVSVQKSTILIAPATNRSAVLTQRSSRTSSRAESPALNVITSNENGSVPTNVSHSLTMMKLKKKKRRSKNYSSSSVTSNTFGDTSHMDTISGSDGSSAGVISTSRSITSSSSSASLPQLAAHLTKSNKQGVDIDPMAPSSTASSNHQRNGSNALLGQAGIAMPSRLVQPTMIQIDRSFSPSRLQQITEKKMATVSSSSSSSSVVHVSSKMSHMRSVPNTIAQQNAQQHTTMAMAQQKPHFPYSAVSKRLPTG